MGPAMNDQAEAVAGIALLVWFFMALLCSYTQFTKWDLARQLAKKTNEANYYTLKYRDLKRQHEYLKRSSARIARLYKIYKDKYR